MAENRVKEEREKLGWTQDKLSQEADIPLSSLQKIERSAFTPNVDHALGIAGAIGKPVELLFFRNRSRIRLGKAKKLQIPTSVPSYPPAPAEAVG